MRSGKRAFDAPVWYEPDERHGGVGGEAGPPAGEGQADAEAVQREGGLALVVGADRAARTKWRQLGDPWWGVGKYRVTRGKKLI